MNKITPEVNSIINRLKQLKISHVDFLKNEIIINKKKINLNQQGGFFNESSSDLFSETSNMNQKGGNLNYSETSDMNQNVSNRNYSETSDVRQNVGNRNYSETSDMNQIIGNQIYSETSIINQNGGNQIYSETSIINQNGGNQIYSETSIFKKNSDIYSETSEFKNSLKGGVIDTLQSITELEDSQLDLDIFKRSVNKQQGGSINFNNKQKLNNIGINSSSTSSVCE
jgi:hypothetical protein